MNEIGAEEHRVTAAGPLRVPGAPKAPSGNVVPETDQSLKGRRQRLVKPTQDRPTKWLSRHFHPETEPRFSHSRRTARVRI